MRAERSASRARPGSSTKPPSFERRRHAPLEIKSLRHRLRRHRQFPPPAIWFNERPACCWASRMSMARSSLRRVRPRCFNTKKGPTTPRTWFPEPAAEPGMVPSLRRRRGGWGFCRIHRKNESRRRKPVKLIHHPGECGHPYLKVVRLRACVLMPEDGLPRIELRPGVGIWPVIDRAGRLSGILVGCGGQRAPAWEEAGANGHELSVTDLKACWMPRPADLLPGGCAQTPAEAEIGEVDPRCRAESHIDRIGRAVRRWRRAGASSPQASALHATARFWRPLSQGL